MKSQDGTGEASVYEGAISHLWKKVTLCANQFCFIHNTYKHKI